MSIKKKREKEFLTAWSLRFDEDNDVAEQSDSFTGLMLRRVGPGRIEVTCGGIMQNPVLIELLEIAQRVTDTVAFIVLKARVGGSFAFCALSRCVNAQGLTAVVWRELRRLAHHRLATRDLPLVTTRMSFPRARM